MIPSGLLFMLHSQSPKIYRSKQLTPPAPSRYIRKDRENPCLARGIRGKPRSSRCGSNRENGCRPRSPASRSSDRCGRPVTNTSSCAGKRASASSSEPATVQPGISMCCRVTTTFVRLGSGRPNDSKVLRPMTTGCPVVSALKRFRSSEICHSSVLPPPITPFRATATIIEIIRLSVLLSRDTGRILRA